jgi:hypothetical protein
MLWKPHGCWLAGHVNNVGADYEAFAQIKTPHIAVRCLLGLTQYRAIIYY